MSDTLPPLAFAKLRIKNERAKKKGKKFKCEVEIYLTILTVSECAELSI